MESTKCPALVEGKSCGLALVLVDQDIATETEIYECPLGHRKHVMLGRSAKRNCPAFAGGKECGLALTLVERDLESATEVYECPLGHRTHVPREPIVIDEPSF